MINSPKIIFVTFSVVLGILFSFTLYDTVGKLQFSTEINAENNYSSGNLIAASDASADDQININCEIPIFDIILIENKILSSFFVLTQPSFSIWLPPKIS